MDALRQFLVRGVAKVSAGRAAAFAASLLAHVLLTRLLDPQDVGLYFLVFTLVAFSRHLGQLGLPRAAVLLIGRATAAGDGGKVRSEVAAVMRLGLAGGAATALLLACGPGAWTMRWMGGTPGAWLMLLVALWTLARVLEGLVAETLRGLQRIGHAVWFNTLLSGLLLTLALAVMAALAHHLDWRPRAVHAVAAAALTAVLTSAAGGVILMRRLPAGRHSPSPGYRRLLSIAWPFFGSALLVVALENVGVWIVSATTRDLAEVAVFTSALRLSRLVATPALVANGVLIPVIAELYARGDNPRLTAVVRLSASATGLVALAGVLLVLVAGAPILGFVFGDFYRSGAPILILLSLGQLLVVATGPSGVTLLMSGRQNIHFALNAASFLLVTVAGLWLTRAFGPTGMAVASLAGAVAAQTSFLLAVRWSTGLWTCPVLHPPRVAALWRRLAAPSATL